MVVVAVVDVAVDVIDCEADVDDIDDTEDPLVPEDAEVSELWEPVVTLTLLLVRVWEVVVAVVVELPLKQALLSAIYWSTLVAGYVLSGVRSLGFSCNQQPLLLVLLE